MRALGRSGRSLRTRLIAGAGLMALLALAAAALAAQGAMDAAARLERAVAAQERIELMAAVSGRIGDFAMVAVEAARNPTVAPAEREARLREMAQGVHVALDRLEEAMAGAVMEARALDEETQMMRATRGLGLARMRAQFEALEREIARPGGLAELRAELDGFAKRFAPLLNQAMEEERRDRDAAVAAARTLRDRLVRQAAAIGAGAAALLLLFHLALTRPLLARIARVGRAAAEIGEGRFATRLSVSRRDELGLLFARINRLAARLARREDAVAADRARLEEEIAARTEALREANARLERADAERRRFFADVGHELRTPLTVVLGEADLGLRGDPLPEAEARAAFRIIRDRAARLNRRIDDILRVARSEDGRIDLAETVFDPAMSLRGAADDCARTARRRGVELHVEAEDGLRAGGDPDWMRQVVSGLLDNALRHSPAGGTILIRAGRAGDGGALLSVIDEGEGMTPADRAKALERFARGPRAKPGEGFGVGLALARWVVERHGGRLELLSPAPVTASDAPKGPGLEARVALPPLRAGDEDAPAEAREAAHG